MTTSPSLHRGIPFVVAAVLLMSLQDALFKYLSGGIGLWQVFVLRGLLASALLLGFIRLTGGSGATWRAAFRPWVLARSALFGLMFISFYAAIAVLDLATVSAGYYTAPIFITLLSALLLGERIPRLGWVAVLSGFLGVLVILKPGSASFDPRALLPVFSGLCYALAAIIVRAKCQGEEPAALVASLNLVLMSLGLIASLALAAASLTPAAVALQPFLLGGWVQPGGQALGIIFALALLMILSAFLLVRAYQLTAPSIVAPFDYSYLVFSVLWGVILFAQAPDLQVLAGMALIAGAGLLTLRA